jgi:DNA-binding CsgD family transcriptional regulator
VTTETLDQLTDRQREVLALVARGHSNSEIASILNISLDGAKWHVSEIIGRLGVENRTEAADLWREWNGLVPRVRRRASTWLTLGALRWAGIAASRLLKKGIDRKDQ